MKALEAANTELSKRIDATLDDLDKRDLVKALEPFAKAADNYADVPGDAHAEGSFVDNDATITVAMLREARAALARYRRLCTIAEEDVEFDVDVEDRGRAKQDAELIVAALNAQHKKSG